MSSPFNDVCDFYVNVNEEMMDHQTTQITIRDMDGRARQLSVPTTPFAKISEVAEEMSGEAHMNSDGSREIRLGRSECNDYEAWQVLIYWVVHMELPTLGKLSEELLVRSWALAKYLDCGNLEDEVLVQLMRLYNIPGPKFLRKVSMQALKDAFCKMTFVTSMTRMLDGEDMPIRKLLCEEVVKRRVNPEDSDIAFDKCDVGHSSCGLSHFSRMMGIAEEEYKNAPVSIMNRFEYRVRGRAPEWMYMLEGPKWSDARHLVELSSDQLMEAV